MLRSLVLRPWSALFYPALTGFALLSSLQNISAQPLSIENQIQAAKDDFISIRDKIRMWFVDSGANGPEKLQLPKGITYPEYRARMERYLAPGFVKIEFVTAAQELATTDEELKVSIDGTPKTCRGFISSKSESFGQTTILCILEKFVSTDNITRFQLVHHEYAGLAGIEKNVGPISKYDVSAQLTIYVETRQVPRLSPYVQTLEVVSKKTWGRGQTSIDAAYENVLSGGDRAIIRATYSGTEFMKAMECKSPQCRSEERYYVVDAKIGAGLTGQSVVPTAELYLAIHHGGESALHSLYQGDSLMLHATREVALGKAGRIKLELMSMSGTWHTDESSQLDDRAPAPGVNRAYFTAAATMIGAEFLATSPEGRDAIKNIYGGIDLAEISSEAGLARTGFMGFSGKLSIGGKIDSAFLKGNDGKGWRFVSERSAYAKLATEFETSLAKLELFLQGNVGQMQFGKSDPTTFLSITSGVRSRF